MFLILFAVCTLLALYFVFREKKRFDDALTQFNHAIAERNRLEHLNPFPNGDNYRKMKEHLGNYGVALSKLKDELKTQMLPVAPLAPNEFQSRLRQTIINTAEKAGANRVKLPDNFHLGFDEFTAALPNTAAAHLLGQELAQAELLMNILIDARVDSVTAFRRAPLPEEASAGLAPTLAPGPKSAGQMAAGPKMLERNIVDLTFSAVPSSARKVLNQIAGSDNRFFIIRTLHVRSEQEKGPPREQGTGAETASSAPNLFGATTAKTPPSGAIKFIVGNEHIEMSARIEMLRFTF